MPKLDKLPSSRRFFLLFLPIAVLGVGACGDGVDDPAKARLAYLGLDGGVDRALKLGLDGFNAAQSANIPEQSEAGDVSGTMGVGGQVDQGSSDNKGLRLLVTLDDYSDGPVEDDVEIAYDGGPVNLDLNLKGLPNAELTGTMVGDFAMTGDLSGTITLDLDITGQTEEGSDGVIVRKPGTIRVVGTASSPYGAFQVDVSL